MALTATNSSGTQSTTQSPQAAGSSSPDGGNASGLQPGTASSLLSQSSGGMALHNTALSTVDLNGVTASQVQTTPPVAKHHVNPALFSIAILFFVVAVALFWHTSKSEKITT